MPTGGIIQQHLMKILKKRLRHKENEIQHSSTKSWSGWQRRTASLTTTGRQSGKSSPSEEFPSPGVPWCGLEIKHNLLASYVLAL